MADEADSASFAAAMLELHDALARARAQLHVLRLAAAGLRDERDVRALLVQIGTVEEELKASEDVLRRHGLFH